MTRGAGKRAGSRRGARAPLKLRPAVAGYAAAITAAVIAWGYLVFAAIDFGISARSGRASAWWLLVLASVGAMACMFVALVLVARLTRTLGISKSPTASSAAADDDDQDTAEIRPVGGHRAPR